jgi:cytochrome bd-I ubiquinol oxidase subunit X
LHGAVFFFMIVADGLQQTTKETAMWYFTWILGIGVALGFGIINVMWLDAGGKFARDPERAGAAPEDAPS